MHNLEHRGEALVEPCVLGGGRTFPVNTQFVLARWILMCAVVLDHVQATPVVPQSLRDVLHAEWEPPKTCPVWLAATVDGADEVNLWPRSLLLGSERERANGYFCTFRIKHFVAQAFVPLDRTAENLAFDRSGGTGQHVIQIWPSISSMTWPPPSLLPGDQVEAFARSFER